MPKKKLKWYEPKDPTPREQCPCCDYFALPERGTYLICKVCFWEDDGQDIDNLEGYGPNVVSLREARNNFKKFGASEERFLKNVCTKKERNKYKHSKRNVD